MAVAYTKTDTSISVVINFRPVTIPSSHPNFKQIADLVRKPRTTEAQLSPLIDIPAAIEKFTGGNVTVVNGRLFFKGFEVKSKLAKIIIDFVQAGQKEAARPFELFMEKAFANPDPRAIEGLFDWCVAGGLPITPDGDILAWKAVQADYLSTKSGPRGKLRHMIGDVVEEPRNECDANPDRTCSRGIHFCSVEYITSHGYGVGSTSRIMAVTISPTDVVAFPNDYNLSKGRTSRLTVVGEVPVDQVPGFYPADRRVYDGWTAKPAAKPARYVGQQVKDADGDAWELTEVGSKIVRAKLVSHGGSDRDYAFSATTGLGQETGVRSYTLHLA